MIRLLGIPTFNDYELIDSGDFQKLERFGTYTLIRPEPQAVWNRNLSQNEWEKAAHAKYALKQAESVERGTKERGTWIKLRPEMPDRWFITYQPGKSPLTLKLALTTFGHIGIFPEQAENWNYIGTCVKECGKPEPKVLNLFAYTGIASLVAKSAGANVTHLDSVKQIVTWARENMEASSLHDIRWVVEDALTFVKREVKRGNRYSGIILDPPKYGRGPQGEKWLLEDQINEMIKLCSEISEPDKFFFVLNLYSMGFSSIIADNLAQIHFKNNITTQSGELFIPDKFGKRLPLGIFTRFRKGY